LPGKPVCGILVERAGLSAPKFTDSGMIWSYTWAELKGLREWLVRNPLTTAFSLSFAVHLALFGGWKIGDKLGWWKHQATWLLEITKKKHKPDTRLVKLTPPKAPPRGQEIPMTFVEVDPSTAALEPPKDSKYYGAHSSLAANPDPKIETQIPKIDGKQEKMVRLENVPKPGPQPLQPTPPPKETKPREAPGDTYRKPDDKSTQINAKPEKTRTLAKAMERNPSLAGQKLRQDGGVSRRGHASFDVIGSAFGAYDAAVIAAIQQRWYDLLDNTPFTHRTGKVQLEFHLNVDGSVTELRMLDNDVGENLAGLCQRAIVDPAPFGPWPEDMKKKVGKDFREVLFTFYYE
jgi:hypothetical protein